MKTSYFSPKCFLKASKTVHCQNVDTSRSEKQRNFFEEIGTWSKTAGHQPHQLPAALLTHSTMQCHSLHLWANVMTV